MTPGKDNMLFVLLHSYNNKPSSLQSIVDFLKKHYDRPTIVTPVTTLHYLSVRNVNVMVNDLLETIDKAFEEKKRSAGMPPRIILIGHSMGALFARKVYVCACGENANAPFEKEIAVKTTREWAAYVERIILFAGMNNGWSIDYHLSLMTGFWMSLGTFIGNVMSMVGAPPTMLSVRKGGSFITQLRIQSIEMQKQVPHKGVGDALVVQLLGTVDDIVSPDDNVDLISGSNFVYLEMPFSKHDNVIQLNDATMAGSSTIGAQRSAVLLQALTESREQLVSSQVVTAESSRIVPDERVTDVVFVIHGIRDEGYWTHKVAQCVVKEGRKENRRFETETSSYGYFPLLHFTLPAYRRAKVEWLMEQYTENMARYPKADFSFVGHSNGTYLMAKALKEYPACRFRNVLFAGSVVSHKYDWEQFKRTGRVQKVFNMVATADWVVGIFPKAFHYLGFRDLGSAGYDGFKTLPISDQVICIPGGHGAGVKEQYWAGIAEFIVHGKLKNAIPKDPRSRRFVFFGWISVFLLLFAVAAALSIAYAIWNCFHLTGGIRMLVMVLYSYLIWKILTKL